MSVGAVVLLSACTAPTPAPTSTATADRVVFTRNTSGTVIGQAVVTGTLTFIENKCLAIKNASDEVLLTRFPMGSELDQAGSDWVLTMPGSDPVTVGESISGGGDAFYSADSPPPAEIPQECVTDRIIDFAG